MNKRSAHHDGVWIPYREGSDINLDNAVVVRWLQANCPRIGDRITVGAVKQSFSYQSSVRAFASNGNVATPRSSSPTRSGGPVLVFTPSDELLPLGVSLARGLTLGLVEYDSPRLEGWAAATRALNLTTGEHHPGVGEEIHAVFERLAFYGNNGYRSRDSFSMNRVAYAVDDLRAEQLDDDFIVSYMIALGTPYLHAKELRVSLAKR
ncbi:hypothetical protein BH93_02500 [Rhodococcoides fascians A25f]|uniref:hypothetical protein n=1 Tax=Rhodococcoides fascians TaxID=1828 RepID=UPI0012D2ECCC|nr:hypothetical protein [Rhodococcus fascians]QII04385.1 hypothetical protein BH93_02500 [Rhodococcus fascians A25f]